MVEVSLKPDQFPREVIAVRAYQRAYAVPLIAPAGSTITILRRDQEWPGWIWCEGEHGVDAWVPEAWLTISGNRAGLSRDYNSIEISFDEGDLLTLIYEESGWYWVRNFAGETGWAPADYLQT